MLSLAFIFVLGIASVHWFNWTHAIYFSDLGSGFGGYWQDLSGPLKETLWLCSSIPVMLLIGKLPLPTRSLMTTHASHQALKAPGAGQPFQLLTYYTQVGFSSTLHIRVYQYFGLYFYHRIVILQFNMAINYYYAFFLKEWYPLTNPNAGKMSHFYLPDVHDQWSDDDPVPVHELLYLREVGKIPSRWCGEHASF